MFHFKLFALFWYRNTSNGAQRTRGEGAPWRAVLKDSARYGKGVHRNSVLHFLVEHNLFSMKRRNSWKVGNLEIISHISPPTQANNK